MSPKLPKMVSPAFFGFAIVAASIFLYASLHGIVGPFANKYPVIEIITIWCVVLLSQYLVYMAFSVLGIQMRTRSVERLQGNDHEDGDVAFDLPIRILQGRWLILFMSVFIFFAGFVLILMPLFIPLPIRDTTPACLLGLLFLLIGFLITRCKPSKLCEIDDKGILAPAGFWSTPRFVPWQEVARCEIIHDDERMGDYFVLWDKKGRRRFQSRTWIGRVRSSDRARIFRALRSRFPERAKFVGKPEPALVRSATTALWDRELDA